eukprot:TRINITY_DN6167_c0_g1_i1.p1 TRINITY_DN6167_c0_g1~~TRINITY_DN6167_c0_g1_i1.p1  ORF type:complete len:1698 (+),score=315.76 TRINITY_DN6167_c0_g1_i1:434-5095(+)
MEGRPLAAWPAARPSEAHKDVLPDGGRKVPLRDLCSGNTNTSEVVCPGKPVGDPRRAAEGAENAVPEAVLHVVAGRLREGTAPTLPVEGNGIRALAEDPLAAIAATLRPSASPDIDDASDMEGSDGDTAYEPAPFEAVMEKLRLGAPASPSDGPALWKAVQETPAPACDDLGSDMGAVDKSPRPARYEGLCEGGDGSCTSTSASASGVAVSPPSGGLTPPGTGGTPRQRLRISPPQQVLLPPAQTPSALSMAVSAGDDASPLPYTPTHYAARRGSSHAPRTPGTTTVLFSASRAPSPRFPGAAATTADAGTGAMTPDPEGAADEVVLHGADGRVTPHFPVAAGAAAAVDSVACSPMPLESDTLVLEGAAGRVTPLYPERGGTPVSAGCSPIPCDAAEDAGVGGTVELHEMAPLAAGSPVQLYEAGGRVSPLVAAELPRRQATPSPSQLAVAGKRRMQQRRDTVGSVALEVDFGDAAPSDPATPQHAQLGMLRPIAVGVDVATAVTPGPVGGHPVDCGTSPPPAETTVELTGTGRGVTPLFPRAASVASAACSPFLKHDHDDEHDQDHDEHAVPRPDLYEEQGRATPLQRYPPRAPRMVERAASPATPAGAAERGCSPRPATPLQLEEVSRHASPLLPPSPIAAVHRAVSPLPAAAPVERACSPAVFADAALEATAARPTTPLFPPAPVARADAGTDASITELAAHAAAPPPLLSEQQPKPEVKDAATGTEAVAAPTHRGSSPVPAPLLTDLQGHAAAAAQLRAPTPARVEVTVRGTSPLNAVELVPLRDDGEGVAEANFSPAPPAAHLGAQPSPGPGGVEKSAVDRFVSRAVARSPEELVTCEGGMVAPLYPPAMLHSGSLARPATGVDGSTSPLAGTTTDAAAGTSPESFVAPSRGSSPLDLDELRAVPGFPDERRVSLPRSLARPVPQPVGVEARRRVRSIPRPCNVPPFVASARRGDPCVPTPAEEAAVWAGSAPLPPPAAPERSGERDRRSPRGLPELRLKHDVAEWFAARVQAVAAVTLYSRYFRKFRALVAAQKKARLKRLGVHVLRQNLRRRLARAFRAWRARCVAARAQDVQLAVADNLRRLFLLRRMKQRAARREGLQAACSVVFGRHHRSLRRACFAVWKQALWSRQRAHVDVAAAMALARRFALRRWQRIARRRWAVAATAREVEAKVADRVLCVAFSLWRGRVRGQARKRRTSQRAKPRGLPRGVQPQWQRQEGAPRGSPRPLPEVLAASASTTTRALFTATATDSGHTPAPPPSSSGLDLSGTLPAATLSPQGQAAGGPLRAADLAVGGETVLAQLQRVETLLVKSRSEAQADRLQNERDNDAARQRTDASLGAANAAVAARLARLEDLVQNNSTDHVRDLSEVQALRATADALLRSSRSYEAAHGEMAARLVAIERVLLTQQAALAQPRRTTSRKRKKHDPVGPAEDMPSAALAPQNERTVAQVVTLTPGDGARHPSRLPEPHAPAPAAPAAATTPPRPEGQKKQKTSPSRAAADPPLSPRSQLHRYLKAELKGAALRVPRIEEPTQVLQMMKDFAAAL